MLKIVFSIDHVLCMFLLSFGHCATTNLIETCKPLNVLPLTVGTNDQNGFFLMKFLLKSRF